MNPLELLRQLNELDEHPRIEAKSGSEAGKSVLETICAFANEPGLGGGWLLLGVVPDEQALWPQYKIVGVSNPDKLQSDITSQCASMFNIPIRPQIEVIAVKGKRVLSVFTPEAAASAKPVFFQATGLPKGAFRRIGSSDIRCTEEDLSVFYGDRASQSVDASVLADAEMEEIDPAAVGEYRRLRAAVRPDAEELTWPDPDLLRALRCVERDAKGVLRPTVAGMLLFGSPLGLRRHFPMMRVDYIRVPGRQWVEDPHRRFETLDLRVPLIRLVGRAINTILDDLPKAFSLPDNAIHRQDLPLIPTRVLREAVVNAVMHRSYRVHSPVQIIRYSNRIEIRNPGYSLVAAERWGEPGSVTRNPNLAAVLHEVNLAETKGSGIRVMRQIMRESNLTPPTFESDRHKDIFVTTFLFHHLLDPDDLRWLASLNLQGLGDADARALVYVRETFAIDNSAYRDLNQVDVLNASQHLRRLRDQGVLEQKGKGSATFYVPTERFLATLTRHPESESPESGWREAKTGQQRTPAIQVSPEPIQLSQQPIQLSDLPIQLSDLPPALQAEIAALGNKPSLQDFRRALVAVCAWRPLSAADLARLFGRTRVYLLNKHLSVLVADGQLEKTHPDQPKHPNQAYRAMTRQEGRP